MSNYVTTDLRNLALMGQASSGKTSLVEALLFKAGVLGTLGAVEKGDTVCDHTPEEKEHGHSLYASVCYADYAGKQINLIDTPGYPDFIGQAIAMMPAVETGVIVIDAHVGLNATTRRLMRYAAERNLCRMIVINKIDAENIDLPALVQAIQGTFGKQCLPINLPARGGTQVVDCFFNPQGDSDFGSVAAAHGALVDQVVEVDEELMAAYLEQGDIKPEQLHAPFEKALRQGHLVPICFTASRPHTCPSEPVGIEAMLDIIVKLAPNPTEGNPRPFYKEAEPDTEIHAQPDANQHVLAHVFQIKNDPFVGKLCDFRVHQGTITKDTQLYIDDVRQGESKKPFKVGHLFKLQGAKAVEVDRVIAGDIAAVAKVQVVHFDAVLHDSHDEDGIHLRPLNFPEPMAGLAIMPTRHGDEQKISEALSCFCEEDPCFAVTHDPVTKETVIHGMGDMHLRVILEKLKERYHVQVESKAPKIAYRETIQTKAEGHHRHKKQTGGAGQFGEVYLRIEPLPRDAGIEFNNDTCGGSIPHQFLPAIEKGIRQVIEQGAVAGYPMQDIRVSVYDGKYHPVDSKEIAFVTAGKRAFIDAIRKAQPALLEPLVELEITVPETFVGVVTGDLSGKRGRIQATDMLPGHQTLVKAIVPLSEIVNYQAQLKSVTGGQGSFSMDFHHYDPLPHHLQEKMIAAYAPHDEDD